MIVCRIFCVGSAAKKFATYPQNAKTFLHGANNSHRFCVTQKHSSRFWAAFLFAVLIYKAFDICLDIVRLKVVYSI